MDAILLAAGVQKPNPGGMSMALFPPSLNMADMASDEATQKLMLNGSDTSSPPNLLGIVSFGKPSAAQIKAANSSNDSYVLAGED